MVSTDTHMVICLTNGSSGGTMRAAEHIGDAVVTQAWRRAELCGLDPHTCLTSDAAPDEIDPKGRLLLAAAPVLDRVARVLAGTSYAVLLADRSARVLDIRAGDVSVRERVRRSGVSVGRLLTEELVGTNAIGTTLEAGQGVTLVGDDHYAEPLRGFSCYGHPIIHPLSRRMVGVLDLSCAKGDENPLLAPFVIAAVQDIEERLLAETSSSQHQILTAFERVSKSHRDLPVVAMGSNVSLTNVLAAQLLEPADYVALHAVVDDCSVDRVRLRLASGADVHLGLTRLGGGAILTITPADGGSAYTPPSVGGHQITLICGEAGSGRSTRARSEVAGRPAVWLCGAEAADMAPREWLSRVSQAASAGSALVIEDVHLLSPVLTRRLAAQLPATPNAPIVMTSGPLTAMSGEHARLAALAAAHVELVPLRARRHEIPGLAMKILAECGVGQTRIAPAAMAALMDNAWPNNLREMSDVIRAVAAHRPTGDIVVDDLPERYRAPSSTRRLSPIEQAERNTIIAALEGAGGNKSAAAQAAGVSRTTLYRAMRRYRIA
ncbi:sigma-54-dependent Fis family transcriptional regulator [Mycolicibacter minnesotensis]